jgi:hypothetical protein
VRDARGGAADLLRERLREVARRSCATWPDHYVAVFARRAPRRSGRARRTFLPVTARRVRRAPDAARDGGRSRGSTWRSPHQRSRPASPGVISLQSEVGPLHPAGPPPRRPAPSAARVGSSTPRRARRARSEATAHVYAALARRGALTVLAEEEDALW